MLNFNERLQRLAEITAKIGLNVQPDQEVIISSETLESAPFARLVTRECYKAGASIVTVLYEDPELLLERFKHAKDSSFDYSRKWLADGIGVALSNNAAKLHICSENPMLLANENSDRVRRLSTANGLAGKDTSSYISDFKINWSLVCIPNKEWAQIVFPNLSVEDAMKSLWDAIFYTCRVDEPDHIKAWEDHNKLLNNKAEWLNNKNFSAIRYHGGTVDRGEDTDLTVGLADGHKWCAGSGRAKNGVFCTANIPTEEVFTTPHKDRVNGVAHSTKPLSYNGNIIDGIRVVFKDGKIVDATATKGQETLLGLIATDNGSCRLGECALVPKTSRIAQSGTLFYETLFDENAASHIAIGDAYTEAFRDSEGWSREEFNKRGANESIEHVDWMIGNDLVSVDGIHQDGTVEKIMVNGDWV